MGRYDDFSREELVRRIEQLEGVGPTDHKGLGDEPVGWFRARYADKILNSMPDMLTVFSREGQIVDLVSSLETNHAGIPVEKLIGSKIHELLEPDSAANLRNNLNKVFTTGEWSGSFHNITLDGYTHRYENRIFPLDSKHALCMCRDITDDQLAKEELETIRYAINNVDEEIYACDLEGRMIYANGRFRLHHNVNDDLVKYKIYELWKPAGNFNQWRERLQQIRSEDGAYKYTVRFKAEGSDIMAWDIVAYIIYDKIRKRDVVWFFARNVTQRIINETKIKEINSVMDSILNNIPVYLFVKDPGNEFRYLYWNQAFAEYSGITTGQALGHTDFEIFPSHYDAEKFRRDDLELLRNGERVSFYEEYITTKGDTRHLTTSKALVSMDNRLPLIIGVSWDITEQKNAEKEIIEARIKAEESDRLKSAFLANMSHEIRTPLNAIVGFSQLIGEADNDDEKQQYADIIDANSELLLQLINDILDISKIEAGTLEFKFKTMDLNELCRAQFEVLRTRVGPGVTLIFEDNYRNVEFVCDQNRLAQVITNLLTNAIKFTRKGEVRYGYTIEGDMIRFYVKDTGSGIATNKLQNIFDRFVKLNNFAVGTGLGLSISKMIIEKMGGVIEVESEEGKGSCFYFTVPYCRDENDVHLLSNID